MITADSTPSRRLGTGTVVKVGGLFRSRALHKPAMANRRGHQPHPRSLAGWPEIGQKPKMGATPATTATTNQKMQPRQQRTQAQERQYERDDWQESTKGRWAAQRRKEPQGEGKQKIQQRTGNRDRNRVGNQTTGMPRTCSAVVGGRGSMLRRETSHCRTQLAETYNREQGNLSLLHPQRAPVAEGRGMG